MQTIKDLVIELNKYVDPSSKKITIEGQNFKNGFYTVALHYLNNNFSYSLILEVIEGKWLMGEGAGELDFEQQRILVKFLANANDNSFKIED